MDTMTPAGVRIEGNFENQRNAANSALFQAVIREVYGVKDVIVAHHIVYVREDKGPDGLVYTQVEEIPSADALMFDHEIAQKLWPLGWRTVLTELALTPVEERDALFADRFHNRVAANLGADHDQPY